MCYIAVLVLVYIHERSVCKLHICTNIGVVRTLYQAECKCADLAKVKQMPDSRQLLQHRSMDESSDLQASACVI